MALPLLAAVAGVSALAKVGTGIAQGIKANKMDKNNVRPVEQVQNEYFKNVSDAEQMARLGLPQQQYNLAQQNIQRNQSAVLGQLSRSSNPNAGLQGLLRASNDANLNLDVQNAQARNNNMKYLAQQRGVLGQKKENAFDWNEKSKYLAQAAKAQALRGAGAQNVMGGFSDIGQAAMMGMGAAGGGAGGLGAGASMGGTPNFYNAMQKYGVSNYGTSNGIAA